MIILHSICFFIQTINLWIEQPKREKQNENDPKFNYSTAFINCLSQLVLSLSLLMLLLIQLLFDVCSCLLLLLLLLYVVVIVVVLLLLFSIIIALLQLLCICTEITVFSLFLISWANHTGSKLCFFFFFLFVVFFYFIFLEMKKKIKGRSHHCSFATWICSVCIAQKRKIFLGRFHLNWIELSFQRNNNGKKKLRKICDSP